MSQPIKSVHWVQNQNLIVTGSWDKTLKYWDVWTVLLHLYLNKDVTFSKVNQVGNDAVATIGLNERVYSMDVNGNIAVVACADRNIHVFDLRNFSVPVKSHQIRTVALFNDNRGCARLGSFKIEACDDSSVPVMPSDRSKGACTSRYANLPAAPTNSQVCEKQHINDDDAKLNFAFKCHRDPSTQTSIAMGLCLVMLNHMTGLADQIASNKPKRPSFSILFRSDGYMQENEIRPKSLN
eukprot:766759-Hanusia_phi.AAC.2